MSNILTAIATLLLGPQPTVPVAAEDQILEARVLLDTVEMREFDRYVLAIIQVESAGDHKAISSKGAHGLMQITPVAMREAAKQCNLPLVEDMRKLLEPRRNVQYGSCYFRYILNQQGGDYTRALIIYNGGYKELTKYDRGSRMVHETANYVLQVHRAYEDIVATTNPVEKEIASE